MNSVQLLAEETVRHANTAVKNGDLRSAVDILTWALKQFERLGRVAQDPARQTMSALAMLHRDLCEVEVASAYLDKALSFVNHKTQADVIRLRRAMLIPPMILSRKDLYATRNRIRGDLQAILESDVRLRDPLQDIPTLHFYLAYHGLDDRYLLELQAEVFKSACPGLVRTAPHVAEGRVGSADSRIRIGFLSTFFRDHTIGRLNAGILSALPEEVFLKTLILVEGYTDGFSREMTDRAEGCLRLSNDLAEARSTLAQAELDIIYFADIGMEPLTYYLAFSRSAHLQVTTWGHPVTTGLTNMDGFILASDMEPEGGDTHFTERLIRLTRPNVVYRRPALAGKPRGRASFHLSSEENLYLCPQAIYKFHPDFDGVLAKILRRDPKGRLVLIQSKYRAWDEIFLERLARHTENLNQVTMLPSMSREDYLALLSSGDVMLDPFPFCGGNTTLEALSFGTPVVTLPTRHVRGRLTYSFYRSIGVLDCICKDAGDYVDLAVELGTNPEAKKKVRRKILARCGGLYEKRSAGDELSESLLSQLNLRLPNAERAVCKYPGRAVCV